MLKKEKILLILLVSFLFLLPVYTTLASTVDGTIGPSPKWAFGDTLGWINFGCDNCNVHVTDTGLTGYAWSKEHGWINLSPDLSGNTGVTNNCLGQLGGKAWSKALGWVDFSGVTIGADGIFTGKAGVPGTSAGTINFSCDNSCEVSTDWLQCAFRESPAQVVINHITNITVPSVSANITISNEGLIDTEYQYEWCVVSDINNTCGGGDDIFYSLGAKDIPPGVSWTTDKNATVPNVGTYYFKLVVHYGINYSVASQVFTAVNEGDSGSSSGGGGSSGSSSGETVVDVCPNIVGNQSSIPTGYTKKDDQCVISESILNYDTADFNRDHIVNSVDFSILLYFWKKDPPFKNMYVDINADGNVNSVDFSILLSQWGRKTI